MPFIDYRNNNNKYNESYNDTFCLYKSRSAETTAINKDIKLVTRRGSKGNNYLYPLSVFIADRTAYCESYIVLLENL